MSTPVSHRFTNVVPSVTKFSGRKKGELTCDVEGFLSQLDDYLASKPDLTAPERLAEAKQFIDTDTSKGDVSMYTRTNKYRVLLKTYEELKAYLRKSYAAVDAAHPILCLGTIVAQFRDSSGSLKDLSPTIYDWFTELATKLGKNAKWVVTDDDNDQYMKLDSVISMLRLGFMLGTCNPLILKHIDRDWDEFDDLTEVMEEVRKAKVPVPETELKQTVNAVNPTSGFRKPIQKFKSVTRQTNTQSTASSSYPTQSTQYRQKPHPPRTSSAPDFSQVKCYKCNRFGHMASHCRVSPYCSFHQATGHFTKDCRAKRHNFSRSTVHSNQQQQSHSSNGKTKQGKQTQSSHLQQAHGGSQSSPSQMNYLDFHMVPGSRFPT